MPPSLLADLVATSDAAREIPGRLAKIARIADGLARVEPGEMAAAVAMLAGVPRQGSVGIGWAALKDLPPPAATPTLTVAEVDRALTAIAGAAGPGSRTARLGALRELMARATTGEQRFLSALLIG